MTTISKSSRAMHMAHLLQTNHQSTISNHQWSDYVRRGWYFVRFNEWLLNGIIMFSFFKKDGSIREAKGTLHPLLIPADKMPKGTAVDHMPNYSTITFFDLDKQEWRSFDITRFIGFVTIYELKEKA